MAVGIPCRGRRRRCAHHWPLPSTAESAAFLMARIAHEAAPGRKSMRGVAELREDREHIALACVQRGREGSETRVGDGATPGECGPHRPTDSSFRPFANRKSHSKCGWRPAWSGSVTAT